MNISFSEAALEYINKKIDNRVHDNDHVVIIDYSDGDSPYYESGNSCYCETFNKYRILVVKKDDSNIKWENYDQNVTTKLGSTFYRSFYEMMFDKNITFDYSTTYGGLILKGDSGLIAEQVSVIIK